MLRHHRGPGAAAALAAAITVCSLAATATCQRRSTPNLGDLDGLRGPATPITQSRIDCSLNRTALMEWTAELAAERHW